MCITKTYSSDSDGSPRKRPLKDIERNRLYRRSVPDEETILEGSEDSCSENEESPMLPKRATENEAPPGSLKKPFLRGHTIATPTIHVDDIEEQAGSDGEIPPVPDESPADITESQLEPTGPQNVASDLPTLSESSDDGLHSDSKDNLESTGATPTCPQGSRESLTLPPNYQSDFEGYPDLASDFNPPLDLNHSRSEDNMQVSEELPLQKVTEQVDSIDVPRTSRSPSPRSMHKIPSLGQMGRSKTLDEDR